MRYILSRTDDYIYHSKKWILGYAFLFWLVTRILSAGILITCTAIYKANEIDAEKLTSFGGNPFEVANKGSVPFMLMVLLVIAPLLEEGIFRLGLSFKKWQIAISLSLIPIAVIWQHIYSFSAIEFAVWSIAAIMILLFVNLYFKQTLWIEVKERFEVPIIWISSIVFAIMHLMAFSNISISLLPYCLCVTAVVFFAGGACAYLRVNLGFWWAVGFHIFNNLPPVIIICSL